MFQKCKNKTMHVDDALEIARKNFLSCTPVNQINWHGLLDDISWEHQEKLLNFTVNNSLVIQYPIRLGYQIAFLKHIIHHLNKMSVEQHDQIYEKYCFLLESQSGMTDQAGFSFKHYELPGNGVITLKESSALISEGTTGLCSWQASKAMCEFIFNNSEDFRGKNILELGSGVGLTGIFMAKHCDPSMLVLSDCHSSVLGTLKHNVELNFPKGAKVDCDNPLVNCLIDNGDSLVVVMDLDWSYINESNLHQLIEPEVLVGTDIVYDHSLFQPLLTAINHVFSLSNNRCKFFLSCTERNQDTLSDFLELLVMAKYRINEETVCPSKHFQWDSTTDKIRIFTITRDWSYE
ncbi:protein-lysine N-methyltransferase EEF2KMT [Malaya genurostris]|uniref:protein-lysine N-methyltransferase EEF2KMT n=1 Tax=Malaya genurostris TaxID=325434 RepID=UPI0026F3B5BB|nr:protein-lysine N-methyltransferase EEF2KMT [Malaya genurostris]XP_058451263.1 protein-lysine N-methyltransferase EEF2KMT [Malaya genurostris]XP_058451264.1 protein-lysine N-methyltransferase EEF2KMT [Malaya genurostris]XP_058451265.1 protein-lysine N-methyltransferase EEF2KMT [Malaya genurostris]